MSNGAKVQRTEAMEMANELISRLGKACQRVEIAGSLRRGKQQVGDIEIVCIPHLQPDLFGGEDYLWREVREALAAYKMVKGGDRYQQYNLGRCMADVFVTTREQWGVIFTLRTGSAEFSRKLVTPRTYGGMMPNDMHILDGRLWNRGVSVETQEERDLLAAMGLEWVEPEQR